ncbi:MAG: phosphosulfolactate synthase [Rhodothermia bacterium]|nr:phosphosulfolactate synthase [Rhodothermia bacterium]
MIHPHFTQLGTPERPLKPRTSGLTLMLDKGLSTRQVEDVLDAASDFIDVVKLGWGTAAITPRLEEKIAAYQAAAIPVFFGGTMFEAFYLRDRVVDYVDILRGLEMEWVEVSDGSIEIEFQQKLAIISSLSEHLTVLSEVGSKDREHIMPPYKWVEQIRAEFDAGSQYVICEARESGTVGLYRPSGEVREGLVDEIVDMVGAERVIFEAPRKAQQVWFIRHLGSNVNLGNILPEEIIPLETLRLGLRGDTLLDFLGPSGDEGVQVFHAERSGNGAVRD